jgi:hypothetical protein
MSTPLTVASIKRLWMSSGSPGSARLLSGVDCYSACRIDPLSWEIGVQNWPPLIGLMRCSL